MAPMVRRCPACSRSMQPLRIKRAEVDWCSACRSLWFDRDELQRALGIAGAPVITREHPAAWCPACGAGSGPRTPAGPPVRRSALWFSRIDGTDVLACIDCAGSFVSERALGRRPSSAFAGLDATFVCWRCGDAYPLASALAGAGGLHCARCAPEPPSDPQPSRLESALASVVELLRRAVG